MSMYKQYDLFHPITEEEQGIFELAKQYKDIVKNHFNRVSLLQTDISQIKNNYGVLKYKFDVNLVSDKESAREPSSPRVFLWQFIPSITFEIDGQTEELLKPGNPFDSFLKPMVIPKWINSLFSEKSFSKADFQEIVSQYYALETISTTLANKDFTKYIQHKLNEKPLIIHFDGQIFPISKSNLSTIYDDSLLNKIKNYFAKIKNNLKPNWYIISTYVNFTEKHELLTALGDNKDIQDQIKPLSINRPSFLDLFHNDYLFLNNNWYQIKHNTHGWECDCILSPSLLTSDFSAIDPNSLYKSNVENEMPSKDRTMYFYTKKEDTPFLRHDMLLSDVDITATRLVELLSIVHFITT